MNFQLLNTQRKAILIISLLGIISVFLPWVTVSIFGESQSVNGFRGVGIIVFIAFAVAGTTSIIGDQSAKLDKNIWLAALASGFAALLFTVISFGSSSNEFGGGMGLVDAGNGFGIWLSLIASIGILLSAWFLKAPNQDLKSSFESIKENIPVKNESSKIDELEKLIEMKNLGKISEEEYQQLKSKIL